MPGEDSVTKGFCPLQAKGCDKINQVTVDMGTAKTELQLQGRTVARIDQKCSDMGSDLNEIKICLKGNGQEGLVSAVTRNTERGRFNFWFACLLIGSLVTAAIMLIANHLFKFGI